MPEPLESLTLRPFQSDDEPAVIALWRRSDLVVPHNDPQRDIAAKCRQQPELFTVAVHNSTIIATVMAGYDGHRGWIYYLAVDPAYRQQGIGRRMVRTAMANLRALGCPKLNLMVRGTNRDVIQFYQRLGFVRDDVLCLGQRLDGDPQ